MVIPFLWKVYNSEHNLHQRYYSLVNFCINKLLFYSEVGTLHYIYSLYLRQKSIFSASDHASSYSIHTLFAWLPLSPSALGILLKNRFWNSVSSHPLQISEPSRESNTGPLDQ